MERSHFRLVKEAFAAQPESSLETLGVTLKKGGDREWQQVECPACSDTDGSASIARATGHLRCHQCGRKADLFEWHSEQHQISTWDSCKAIGEALGIPFVMPKKPKGKEVQKMTPDRLDRAIVNLLESPEAEWARKHFKDRGLFDPVMFATFGIGFLEGAIIFAQFYPNGELRQRYRIYTPNQKQKWRWSKGQGGPIGFWPFINEAYVAKDAQVLVCEGEMDCLVAYQKYKLQKRAIPIFAVTWTGGAGAPVTSAQMFDWMRSRVVWICYDNDTFQGPDLKTHRAPDPRKYRDLVRRRENVIYGVAGKFAANKCDVRLMAVPMDPIDHHGGDLRDWADSGKEWDELPHWGLKELVDPEDDPEEVTHAEVFMSAGKFIRTKGAVATIERPSLTVPLETRIVCPMGTKPCCGICPVTKIFTEQFIDWKLHREALLEALISPDTDRHIIRNLVCKPAACNECKLEHDVADAGSHWTVSPGVTDEGDGMKSYHVISVEQPSLSGDVRITGYAYHVGDSTAIFATSIEQLDKPEVDLDLWHHDLVQMTPWGSTNEDHIDEHVAEMVHDYTHNVTQIYGRPELHLGVLLVAHSCLWYHLDGHRIRGWLDACFFGDTRQGKSETIKRMFAHWQLGNSFTCMENYSRAGLTVGGAESGTQMRPGLWPKNNRKMLFLDEFHHMSSLGKDRNVMIHLQSARDEGKVSALKVYGDFKLQAAVRLITAANWSDRNQQSFQYFCQHLLGFYGVPESLARMDFAWCVHGYVPMTPEDVIHRWTPDLARALILRAWAMEPHQIHLAAEAIAIARQTALEWDAIYAGEDLPLHTGIEKHLSILRIAIAIANICYSHPSGKEEECEVREVHVRWAIAFILQCWENLQYDSFSRRVIRARTVTLPYHVEACFTVQLDLGDPDHALVILSRLSEANSSRSLMGFVMGNGEIEEQRHFTKWLGFLQRCSALQERTDKSQWNVIYTPTEGALLILRKLLHLARTDPKAYVDRYTDLARWFGSQATVTPPGLEPLDFSEPEEFSDGVPF